MNTIESEPMGMVDRLKAAGQVVMSGKLPNPLSEAPKDLSRAALVQELTDWAREERKFWKDIFERMREEQRFAAGDQWQKDYQPKGECDDPYIGDIVQQLVNRVVASLYAKNPTPRASRLEKLLYEVWDGAQESLRGAQAIVAQFGELIQRDAAARAQLQEQKQQAQALGAADVLMALEVKEAALPALPNEVTAAMEVLQDYERGMAEKELMERIAETAELLLKHRWKKHKPDFKVLLKQAVTQAVVSRVAFVQVDYRRDMETSPTDDPGIELSDKLAALQQKMQALEQSDEKDSTPLREEVRLLKESLAREMGGTDNGQVTYEGTIYQLLPATSVIIDRNCTCLWEFLGARRIARQSLMDLAAAEKRYRVSLKDCGAVLYGEDGSELDGTQPNDTVTRDTTEHKGKVKQKVCVWHIYDKDAQLCYVVCDGVKNFLEEPYQPSPAVERFWPIVPITLNAQVVERNEPDRDVTIYPRSHVRLQMPMQEDINTAGEGLREHRLANRPGWVALGQRWEEGDLAKLSSARNAHEVLRIASIAPGEKVADFLQTIPTQKIDGALYDPGPSLQAAMLATGLQPANLGAQAGGEKATGQAIAEGARISADQSNVDGVDFALSVIAQMTWEMEIQETSEQTVRQICGPGAVWSNLRRAEVQQEIFLEVEAGSSGRPNQALDAQKFKEIAPLAVPWLMQAGIPLDVLIKEAFRILGIKLDVDDLLRKAQMQPAQPMAAPQGALPSTGAAPPGLPAGGAAPNVTPGGVPGAPPIPPRQRQQVVRSAVGW